MLFPHLLRAQLLQPVKLHVCPLQVALEPLGSCRGGGYFRLRFRVCSGRSGRLGRLRCHDTQLGLYRRRCYLCLACGRLQRSTEPIVLMAALLT